MIHERDAQAARCQGCREPLNRDWVPTDPTLVGYHAGCRPTAGRLPVRLKPVEPCAVGCRLDDDNPEHAFGCSDYPY